MILISRDVQSKTTLQRDCGRKGVASLKKYMSMLWNIATYQAT